MHRKIRFSAILAALAIVSLLAPSAGAQDDMANVQIKTHSVASGVWMLEGAGGNIGVSAGEDGIFLVDDQFAPLTDKIRAAVAEISDGEIRFVLNTHWHYDHTGGNENLGESGTVIVAHDGVHKRMKAGQLIEALGREVAPATKSALPVVTFNDSVTFHLNGDEIHAFHVPPAHTDGDSIVHFKKANVVHMGDLFFNGLYPFVDVSSGGSVDGVIAAAEKVLGMVDDETKIIPGHGPVTDKAGLQSYHDLLVKVRAAISALIVEGKSLEEIQAAKPTAQWDDPWGKVFLSPEKFVEIIHSSLIAKVHD